jgi:hypothetical protein
MSAFTVVSFYTPDWKYPEYAQSLIKDCVRLGLDYSIEPKPSTSTYVGNCNLKPYFIRDKLQTLKKPILWMDVDGSIVSLPDLLLTTSIDNFDMAGNRSRRDINRIHVGSIWFNYTNITMEFINTWCEAIAARGIDDEVFNRVWQKFSDKIKFYELPPEYFVILDTPDSPIPDNSCIIHRLSNSSLKLDYKNKIESSK